MAGRFEEESERDQAISKLQPFQLFTNEISHSSPRQTYMEGTGHKGETFSQNHLTGFVKSEVIQFGCYSLKNTKLQV